MDQILGRDGIPLLVNLPLDPYSESPVAMKVATRPKMGAFVIFPAYQSLVTDRRTYRPSGFAFVESNPMPVIGLVALPLTNGDLPVMFLIESAIRDLPSNPSDDLNAYPTYASAVVQASTFTEGVGIVRLA